MIAPINEKLMGIRIMVDKVKPSAFEFRIPATKNELNMVNEIDFFLIATYRGIMPTIALTIAAINAFVDNSKMT